MDLAELSDDEGVRPYIICNSCLKPGDFTRFPSFWSDSSGLQIIASQLLTTKRPRRQQLERRLHLKSFECTTLGLFPIIWRSDRRSDQIQLWRLA